MHAFRKRYTNITQGEEFTVVLHKNAINPRHLEVTSTLQAPAEQPSFHRNIFVKSF